MPATSGLMSGLSLCMIVRNEETRLPRCLQSVSGLVDELIVVDTGSTDATVEIAAAHRAKILRFDFTRVDFAAARNLALSHAGRTWILVLDADETMNLAGQEIKNLDQLDRNVGYFFERRNLSSQSSKHFTDYAVRLFPNRPDFRYRGRVHETIDVSILSAGGRLRKSELRIDHDFAPDRDQRRGKNLLYIDILRQEIEADPEDDSRLDFLAAEYHQLEMLDEATCIVEQIAVMRPSDARAHFFAGTYHLLYQDNPLRARSDFQMALKLRPGYTDAQEFLRIIERRTF